jgi:hypothetical protein
MISQRRIRIAALVILANAAVALQFLPSAQACVDECEKPKFLCMALNTCMQMPLQQKQDFCQLHSFGSCYAKCAFDCVASAPKGPCKGAAAIQCNYKSSLPAPCPAPACAVPVNFRQTGSGVDIGGGILRFEYDWDSNTGNAGDLTSCVVGEFVDYPGSVDPYLPASPPFPTTGFQEPTIVNVPGTDGGFFDFHSTNGAFVQPYAASSFTAVQNYRYTCSCINGGFPVNVMGPLNIVRSVSQNTNGSWKFTVTKPTNGQASINPLP